MSMNHSKKNFNRILGLLCALVLIISAIYVPMAVSAADPIRSVEIKENEAFVFDFTDVVRTDADNKAAATGEAGIGYYGWGWSTKSYTDGENTNYVLQAANFGGKYWSTGGGFRLHTKKADGTYGFYALEPSTRYVVSFKIRVMASPVTVEGSKETYKTYINLGYNSSYDPKKSGLENNYINNMASSIKVYESLIDSNVFTLYDDKGNGTVYPCSENWHSVTYFITTPAEFTADNALAFFDANYHGSNAEIDDVSVTKMGAESGVIVLRDEYAGVDELLYGNDGEVLDLSKVDISDRAKADDHTFEGWYANAERTEKLESITFSKTADTVIYSRWNAPVNVTFKNTLDDSETVITGMAGDMFTYPADPKDPEGKLWFMGWYKDMAGTVIHSVPQFGYADETIYTYWKGEIPGLSVDFENYTFDNYTIQTDTAGQKYKSNRLAFAPTMTKQSEVTYDGSGNAVKYHWNPVQITDKNDHNYYDTTRVTAYDNYFALGKGLDNNTIYVVSFMYLAEKADAPVSFYMLTGNSDNAWGSRRQYDTLKNVTLETDGKWHEVTFEFTTNFNGGGISVFLGLNNTEKATGNGIETIVYFDNVKVEAFAQPYESVITINTNIDGEVVNIKGIRGDEIQWPEFDHPDNAPFNGYYLDKNYTEKYESEVFERLPVTVYAQWLAYSGFTQGFEDYTADQWTNQNVSKTYDNGTPDKPEDDVKYNAVYKSNYLYFYPTMSKQSEVVASGNYAVKFHWNTDRSTDKDPTKPNGHNIDNPESYEHSRYAAWDNVFYLGKGLESNQHYTISFKYKVEKGDQEVQFYFSTAVSNNVWGNRKSISFPEKLKLKPTNGWVEYTYSFVTGDIGSANAGFLGVLLSKNDDVIMYFDDIKVKSTANSAEIVMFMETNTSKGQVLHLGKRGEAVNLPTITHPDGAKFLGWYTDSICKTPFTETVYPNNNTTIYAKWGAYTMSFATYPYEGDSQNEPDLSRVTQKGIGNGDDHAMRFFVDRKADNTTGVGTTQAMMIAQGIEHDAIYRIKYDYKVGSSQNSKASVSVTSADKANMWWSDITYRYPTTYVELPAGGTKGWQSVEFIIKANVKQNSYAKGEELYLRFVANKYKAGDKVDILIDNVLVEKIEAPYVYFDGQNGATGTIARGEVGEKIVAPKELPSRVGYEFDGWYNEPECLTKFTLETFEADTAAIAYAKWKEASQFVYSFENFTCNDTDGWLLSNGYVDTAIKKSGKKAMHFPNMKAEDKRSSFTVLAVEDGGQIFQLSPNSGYIVILNYYVKEYTDSNLNMCFMASNYRNFFVGNNTRQTDLVPATVINSSQAKENKGKWCKKVFALDTSRVTAENGTITYPELYCYFTGGDGWDFYVDDITIIPVPKGKVGVAFETDGVKGCPEYLIGKTGQDYSSKIPEALAKEGMYFKGYYTKGFDGLYSVKTRGNMIFTDKTETVYGRFIEYEINENFDTGFYNKAYKDNYVYTIHDFDYEVYDSEAEGNSKDNVTSGRYSLHRKGDSMYNENSVILTLGNQIAEGERYTVSFKVKMGKHFHTDGAIKVVSSRDFKYAWTTTGDYYPVVPIAELTDGQWHEVSYTFNSVEAFVSLQTPGYVELYMDDFKFSLANDTPLSEPKDYVEYVAAERDANGNLVRIDITAVDVTTIIDESIGIKPTYIDWNKIFLIGGISLGGIAVIVAALIVVLVLKKKKKAKANV